MQIEDAQLEVRTVYLRGFPGQLVAGLLWLASAAAGTWGSTRLAILILAAGGAFIFPLTQLVLRAMARPASLGPENPFAQLAMQVAFIVPLSLPLIGAATLHRIDWFYPAFMLVVGTHYLPFVFLYGMWEFAVLAAVLILASVTLGVYVHGAFAAGGWLTGAVLLAFAIVSLAVVKRGDGVGGSAPL